MKVDLRLILLIVTILAPSQAWSQPQAQARATLSNGKISDIHVINSGNGYTAAPTVSIVGGGGFGATAIASLTNGSIERISL